ncbi:MAG TPA: HIT domain-containing protein, partial [Candidatus Pacearchaeota archaeon]|nr:HIT domain-containing protein [Candidatus Pacearchaeota archaeon]
LISQLDSSNIPDKENIKNNITSMNPEQLEEFLMQNNLIKKEDGAQEAPQAQQCIFCSIVSGQIHSYKIDEDKDSIAVLEINPISKGHVMIIPKEHIPTSDKLPKTAFSFAEKIAEKIKTKLNPKDVQISSANLFGHEVINVLPVYKEETINSQRHQAKPEELEKLHKKLEKKSKPRRVKPQKIKKIKKSESKKLWLPRRVP